MRHIDISPAETRFAPHGLKWQDQVPIPDKIRDQRRYQDELEESTREPIAGLRFGTVYADTLWQKGIPCHSEIMAQLFFRTDS
jgi:hypothetical protein